MQTQQIIRISQEKKEEKSTSSLAKQIYQLAHQKKYDDIDQLQQLISSGTCIDVYDGEFTAIYQHAFECNEDAVSLLIKSFGANINLAAQGAAHGKHQNLVKTLCSAGADLKYVLMGSAQANDIDNVQSYLVQCNDVNAAVWGAARGGHVELVKFLLTKNADLVSAFHGATMGKHKKLADMLFEIITSGTDRIDALCHAAQGAALCADWKNVEAYILEGASRSKAVQGAAMGGHFEWARQFTTITEKAAFLIGAARGGHTNEVMTILKRSSLIYEAIENAALNRHFKLVNTLSERYGINSHRAINAVIHEIVNGVVYNSRIINNYSLLHIINSLSDSHFWNRYALISFLEELKERNCNSSELTKFSNDAESIPRIVKTKNLNFYQASAWALPEIQVLLSAPYFIDDIRCIMMSYLSPYLNQKESFGLINRFSFEKRRDAVVSDLHVLSLSKKSFFCCSGISKADDLAEKCLNANNENDLIKVLKHIQPVMKTDVKNENETKIDVKMSKDKYSVWSETKHTKLDDLQIIASTHLNLLIPNLPEKKQAIPFLTRVS